MHVTLLSTYTHTDTQTERETESMNAFHQATKRSLLFTGVQFQRNRFGGKKRGGVGLGPLGSYVYNGWRPVSSDTSKDSPFAQVKEAPGKTPKKLSSPPPKKKNPIPINKTPRGQVAQRLMEKTDEQQQQQQQQEEEPLTSTELHSSTHFIKGGVPCDPAPPPFRLADYGDDSLYTLVLLRHGESEWNRLNRYTGWCDVNLTERGRIEARDAGRLLKENGVELDHIFTSVLKRANFTTNMALNTAGQHWVPVTKSWRLNERHYGALQGYNKDTAYEELGIDQEFVMEMRRSYRTRPPRMDDDHIHWHGNDRRYVRGQVVMLCCSVSFRIILHYSSSSDHHD